jgi:amino acid transporter
MGGLVVHYIPSLLVINLPPSGEVYSFILEVEGYPGQVFALASAVGLLWLRYRRPDLKRPFKAWSIAIVSRIVLCIALLAAPFFPPKDGKGKGGIWYATYAVVGIGVIVFGLFYWAIWFKIIPKWRSYRIEEDADVLSDGTTVSKLVYITQKSDE